ncbi:hypothetical protein ACTA71_000711 [Dictyostelium dimigraforme]
MKETFSVVTSLEFNHFIIFGYKIIINTDHKNIELLRNQITFGLNQRINRWLQKIDVYNIKLNYIQGNTNHGADSLSRMYSSTQLVINKVISIHHDSAIAGHWGCVKTTELLKRNFIWLDMMADTADYCKSSYPLLQSLLLFKFYLVWTRNCTVSLFKTSLTTNELTDKGYPAKNIDSNVNNFSGLADECGVNPANNDIAEELLETKSKLVI